MHGNSDNILTLDLVLDIRRVSRPDIVVSQFGDARRNPETFVSEYYFARAIQEP